MNTNPDVNFDELARCCEDFNGAQLKAVCVEAGMLALRREADEIEHEVREQCIAGQLVQSSCAVATRLLSAAASSHFTCLVFLATASSHFTCLCFLPSLPFSRRSNCCPSSQDFVEGISEVQAKKKTSLNYYS